MDGTTLRNAFQAFLSRERIEELARELAVVERVRKLDVPALVWALVVGAGSDDSGQMADAYSAYLAEAEHHVVRGSFYQWFSERLAVLMAALTREGVERVRACPPVLTGALAGVRDWLVVDSETVTLRDEMAEVFSATSTQAGLKIHKYFSLGRNGLVDYEITPARDHDAPLLRLDESWRGMGLIVDLGYASHRLLQECKRYGISLVLRLKSGWKPRLLRIVGDDGVPCEIAGEPRLEGLLDSTKDDFLGCEVDYDVAFGTGRNRVEARLVGLPATGSKQMHWCITTLPRDTHKPEHVGQLYRCRWEIECDNRRDKGGSRLDQVRAWTLPSVMAVIHASLLRTMLADNLTYLDLRDRPSDRPPLHGFAVALAMATYGVMLRQALTRDEPKRWNTLAQLLRARGHDPNWRRRPSVLDCLRGTTAPRGRPRRSRLVDCAPEARPFRDTSAA
jgi:putative transposase